MPSVEDTQKGAAAAKNAGMSAATLSTNNADFKNVVIIASNYVEIDTWIKGLN